MKRRNITIPDSEDDAACSGTSLKNSSPVPDSNSLRLSGSSLSKTRSTHVIQDSEDEDNVSLNAPDPISKRTRNRASGNVEVVIPAKANASPSDSSRSSWRGPSAEGTTGFNTPATSVGVAPDSDTQKPRSRVNASARFSRLRSGASSQNPSRRGTKRSAATLSADGVDSESTDAALARALQMEEYEQPAAKKRKTLLNSARDSEELELQELPDLDITESELSDRLTPVSSLSPEPDFIYAGDDSEATEDEDFAAMVSGGSQRRRAFFNRLANHAQDEDEDGTLLTWEDQRKQRRVSRFYSPCYEYD